MRKSRGLGCRSKDGLYKYDVVWEFSALGETSVSISFLMDGHVTANELLKARLNMKQSDQTLGPKTNRSRTDYAVSDDEMSNPAPDSDESSLEPWEGEENANTPPLLEDEWCLFANPHSNFKTHNDIDDTVDAEDTEVQKADETIGNISTKTGLHWDVGGSLLDEPSNKLPWTKTTICPEYKHLFQTPIDSMMQICTLNMWDVIVTETNCYA
jgi:hypothetical protein